MMQRKSKRKVWSFFLASIMIFSMVLQTLSVYAEEEGHTHTEACYIKKEKLICNMIETEGHEHNEKCYCLGGEPICELEGAEEHIHRENCICAGGELICELEEIEGHIHDEQCYAKEEEVELICGQQESMSSIPCDETEEEIDSVYLASEELEDSTSDQDNNDTMLVAEVSDQITAPDWIGNPSTANKWQIVSEQYAGRGQVNKTGHDIDGDGYDDLFYQKNVVPTGIENEFLVYMSISKLMSWDDLLAESEFWVTNAGRHNEKDLGTLIDVIGQGNPSPIYPGKATTSGQNEYRTVVNYIRNGETVHTYEGWYHGNSGDTSKGTGYIKLKSLNKYLIAAIEVSLKSNANTGSGGTLTYNIDLDKMASHNIHFGLDDIVADSVQDTMGEYITYEVVEHCDGTYGYPETSKTLTWTPASNGVTGVQVQENGGLTGYYYNIHQLVYRVHLNVEQDGFNSCAENIDSVAGEPESYRVNQQAVLNYHMKNISGKTNFPVPYVRGLLYDIEFQKLVEGSKIPLEGVGFTITREAGGSTYAEQVVYSDQQTTDENGWIKFHNLPWGNYEISETSYKEGDTFQNHYMNDLNLERKDSVQIGKVINPNALEKEHTSKHSVDWSSDGKNLLFTYNNGVVENVPNRAKITVVKHVDSYNTISSALKNQKYTIKTTSTGELSTYIKPGTKDTGLTKLDKAESVGHLGSVTYELIVPETGGIIKLEEIIPDEVKNKVVFDSINVELNDGSTLLGSLQEKEQGCELTVLPGNDITITITNAPVGTVKIKKEVDNYRSELSEDTFIIRLESAEDNGQIVNVETVLKHQEVSSTIAIKKSTTLNITEVLPKEYDLSQITVSGGGTLSGNQVTVNPGENVVITIHNTYSGQPFFHVSDAIKNIFRWE